MGGGREVVSTVLASVCDHVSALLVGAMRDLSP